MSESPDQRSTDAELVSLAGRGDLQAFEELVARYQRAVFNIALYKSKNYFDAEDLTQDIFLAAFKALPSLKDADHFGGWLFGIAYNRCHKWFQRERTKIVRIRELKKRAELQERVRNRAAASEPPTASTSAPAGHAGTQVLSDALLKLPSEVRETLTLKYLEGRSYQEIEARLGINANRIDYLIRKGKQMLRDRLGRSEARLP